MPEPSSSSAPNAAGIVIAGGRPPECVAFDERVVAYFLNAAAVLGVPRSVAAIYGIVFASPESLSFADIEARLNISKGSVSRGLRDLREMRALKEAPASAGRTARFEPDLEVQDLLQHHLEHRLQRRLAAGQDRLAAIEKAVPGGAGTPEGRLLRARLARLAGMHETAQALLPIARKFLVIGR